MNKAHPFQLLSHVILFCIMQLFIGHWFKYCHKWIYFSLEKGNYFGTFFQINCGFQYFPWCIHIHHHFFKKKRKKINYSFCRRFHLFLDNPLIVFPHCTLENCFASVWYFLPSFFSHCLTKSTEFTPNNLLKDVEL